MPRPAATGSTPIRAALTREAVLDAAVAIADAEGLGALTMRALGNRLGVQAMSLYHHVANKDAILDGIVDRVFSEIAEPDRDVDWRTSLTRRAQVQRDVLNRHPWALGLVESRRSPGQTTLTHHNAVIGVLRSAGFSIHDAAHAYALLDSYVYGFVLQENSLPFTPEDSAEVAEELMTGIREVYPYLAEMTDEVVLQPGYDFGNEFDAGLSVIMDGLAVRMRS